MLKALNLVRRAWKGPDIGEELAVDEWSRVGSLNASKSERLGLKVPKSIDLRRAGPETEAENG